MSLYEQERTLTRKRLRAGSKRASNVFAILILVAVSRTSLVECHGLRVIDGKEVSIEAAAVDYTKRRLHSSDSNEEQSSKDISSYSEDEGQEESEDGAAKTFHSGEVSEREQDFNVPPTQDALPRAYIEEENSPVEKEHEENSNDETSNEVDFDESTVPVDVRNTGTSHDSSGQTVMSSANDDRTFPASEESVILVRKSSSFNNIPMIPLFIVMLLIGLAAMIFTAWQMSDNPDGAFAVLCRFTISSIGLFCNLVLLRPCRVRSHTGHMPVATMDYGYKDPSLQLP